MNQPLFSVAILVAFSISCNAQVHVVPEIGYAVQTAASGQDTTKKIIHYLNDTLNMSLEVLGNGNFHLSSYYGNGMLESRSFAALAVESDTLVTFDANFNQVTTIRQRLVPMRNGYSVRRSIDGSIVEDGFYFWGMKQGFWKEYDPTGMVKKQTLWIEGKLGP